VAPQLGIETPLPEVNNGMNTSDGRADAMLPFQQHTMEQDKNSISPRASMGHAAWTKHLRGLGAVTRYAQPQHLGYDQSP